MNSKRFAAAQKLLDAAHEFWKACHDEDPHATVAALWEARTEIEKLRAALNAIVPIGCHQLHHTKKDRHAPGDPYPVEVRIAALKWGSE